MAKRNRDPTYWDIFNERGKKKNHIVMWKISLYLHVSETEGFTDLSANASSCVQHITNIRCT